ncbi:DUF7824 domain-containing protein [Catenuloplanes indicus]|uniref:DUF7824 domain-containing protein n=1 Tax=Catenuloplanes indicus TaxID=137267 RepID=A0AAE3W3D6_9ACTN|nr:DUF6493 family protein [Catenuloplanes indicus]MDQ0367615.1 hypothetical protein [Catenuloplanes indicus]
MTTELPTSTDTLLQWLDRRQRNKDYRGVASLLSKISEEDRLALAPLVEAQIKSIKGEDWWRGSLTPDQAGLGLIVLGTAPTAARAAALLTRRDIREGWGRIPRRPLLEVVRARQVPWLGDLATRIAGKLTARDVAWSGEWDFAATLLAESGTTPPVTEAVTRGWLARITRFEHNEKPVPVIDRLRDDPYLDLLLPSIFEIDGLGAELVAGQWNPDTREWDTKPHVMLALARLAAEGRLDRAMLLDGTLDRLVRGDRPNALRAFTALHDTLAPTPAEQADRVLDYAQLLPVAPAPVATLGQRALRAVDEIGRLELETLLDASAAVLLRKEKTLVKTQLSALEKIARREPDRLGDIMATVAVAFGHTALDIQERALTIVGKHVGKLGPGDVARLADEAAPLGGDLPARAAALFGTTIDEPEPVDPAVALAPAPPAAEMPPPIASADELAEEISSLVHTETAVRWERVLAGVVALHAASRRDELVTALRPVLARHADALVRNTWVRRPAYISLGEVLRGITEPQDRKAGIWQRMAASVRDAWQDGTLPGTDGADQGPPGVLALRVAEIAGRIHRAPVPMLVATPTHVNGSLDAAVLLDRLIRAEVEGWQPWRLDLEQALVRVPREVDPAVAGRAAALTSESGRRFADWLRGGGLPDPVSTVIEQRAREKRNYYSWGDVDRRVVVALEPAHARPTGLILESRLLRLTRAAHPSYADVEAGDVWAAVLPHHRDTIAAWALPAIAGLADAEQKGAGALLPQLAEGDGPVGPALTYAVAYALGARHEPDRIAAVDAFLLLLARGTTFAGGVGAALADLATDGMVKLSRVVGPLGDIHRSGGSGGAWQLLTVALPVLLPLTPRALPDLLELSAQVAPAAGARGSFAELDAVAARGGSSRLVREAKRLQHVLNR